MRLEAKKYLHDMSEAAAQVARYTAGKTFDDYMRESMMRDAVERQLQIVGEALTRLQKLDPSVSVRITEHRQIIGFRNLLVHGYAEIDDRLVWNIVEEKLPILRREVDALLREEA
jgi:uncharacterized protein with HEPN domain